MKMLVIASLVAPALILPAVSQEDCDNACSVGYEASLVVSDDCHVSLTRKPEYPLHVTGSASCETNFLLSENGVPYDIQAECTNPVFVRSAMRFASGLRYGVKNSAGNACFRPGVDRQVYPLEYRLSED